VSRHDAVRLGMLALAAAAVTACGEAAAQDWRTLNASRDYGGEDRLNVTVEYGAGTLLLAPGTTSSLYTATINYDAQVFTPTVDYADARLRLGLEGGTARGGRNMQGGELDLKLNPDVAVDLQLKFGAADATLDLGGLRVRNVDVQTGASRTRLSVSSPNRERCESFRVQVGAARFEATGLGNLNAERLRVQGGVGEVVLDFTGEWASSMTATIEMGLGSLTMRLPEGLGVRITRGGRLSSFDGQGLMKRGDHYYSSNWDTADNRLSLSLDAALGSVRVVWVDSQ
jgi:hypothetical protein